MVKLTNGSEYELSKNQALVVQDALASGSRGVIMFQTFSISIPFVVEFFRLRRFLKDSLRLEAKQEEMPMTAEQHARARAKVAEIRRELGGILGKGSVSTR